MSPNAWATLVAILAILIAVGFGWLLVDLCAASDIKARCPHKSYTGIAGCRVCDDCGRHEELIEVVVGTGEGAPRTILIWQEIT